ATFTSLSYNKVDTIYLKYTSGSLTLCGSTAITATPGSISLSNSTLAVSAGTVSSGSNVTVTLTARDANNNLISTLNTGTISFSASTGAGVSTGTFGGSITNAGSGNYTNTFTGVLAGTATTLSASISSSALTSTLPTLTVTAGPPSTATSTITLSPSTLDGDNISTSTITVTLKDANNNPISGIGVAVSDSLSSTISAFGNTNSSGQTTATIRSNTPGSHSLSISTPTGMTSVSTTLNVTCVVDTANSTIDILGAADTCAAATISTATSTSVGSNLKVRVIILSAPATACSGTLITLGSSASGVTFGNSSITTDGTGTACTTITTTSAQTIPVAISAPASAVGMEATATFTALTTPNSSQSTIEANPSTNVQTGSISSIVTLTYRDQYGNPIPGFTPSPALAFAATGTGNTIGMTTNTTNALGQITGRISSTVAGTKTLSFTLTSPTLAGTTSVTFVDLQASAANSTIAIAGAGDGHPNYSAGPFYNDGSILIPVTITLKNTSNNPLVDVIPQFSATDNAGTNRYNACTATNSSGISFCTFTTKVAESKTLSITNPVAKNSASPVSVSSNYNIQVPIELLPMAIKQTTTTAGGITWSQLPATITYSAYDGLGATPKNAFSLEATCINTDTAAKNLSLLSGGTTYASVSIPAGTSTAKRFSSVFSNQPIDSSSYVLKSDNLTTTGREFTCYSARVLVTQTAATKTKIYIPLLSGPTDGSVAFTTNTTALIPATTAPNSPGQIGNTDYYSIWKKIAASWNSNGISTTPPTWAFESVTQSSASQANRGIITGLYNGTTAVATTTVGTLAGDGTAIALKSSTALDSAVTPNVNLTVKVSRSGNTNASIYKAGLWATVNPLTSAEVYYQIGRYKGSLTQGTNYSDTFSRAVIDINQFRNPTVLQETVARLSTAGSTLSISSSSTGDTTSDSDTGTAITDLLSSDLLWSSASTGLTLQRTAAGACSNPGTSYRVYPTYNQASGGSAVGVHTSTHFVIQSQ
ncbi:MAG: beta strand repeat-containing protein, partial [Bdellovibrionia bacterium]